MYVKAINIFTVNNEAMNRATMECRLLQALKQLSPKRSFFLQQCHNILSFIFIKSLLKEIPINKIIIEFQKIRKSILGIQLVIKYGILFLCLNNNITNDEKLLS